MCMIYLFFVFFDAVVFFFVFFLFFFVLIYTTSVSLEISYSALNQYWYTLSSLNFYLTERFKTPLSLYLLDA